MASFRYDVSGGKMQAGRLLVIYGGKQGVMYELESTVTIGRASSCEIQLLDGQVSRTHCRIRRDSDGYRIEDLQSSNGTLVNETEIRTPVLLCDNDQLGIGQATLVFNPDFDLHTDTAAGQALFFLNQQNTASLRTLHRPSLFALSEQQSEFLSAAIELLGRHKSSEGLISGLFDVVARFVAPDRLYMLRRDQQNNRFKPVMGRSKEPVISLSRSVLEQVFTSGAPCEVADTLQDVELRHRMSVIRHRIRSVICLPLKRGNDVLAALYLDLKTPDGFDHELKDALYLAVRVVSHPILLLWEHEERAAPLAEEELIIGESESMRQLLETAERVARVDTTVLITGESGTGKERLARLIHQRSPRCNGPFVAVNCAAITASLAESEWFGHEKGSFSGAIERKIGMFEAANRGTLFLDELAEIPMALQVKLLRVIQERVLFRVGGTRPVQLDIRLLAATNKELERAVQEQQFREDLYYRINVINLHLPPLRDRVGDLELLLDHFFRFFERKLRRPAPRIDRETQHKLLAYSWPGNIRELRNVVERIMLLGGPQIGLQELPPEIRYPDPEDDALALRVQDIERDHIAAVYRRCGYNKSETARRLQISRPTLDKKLKEFEIAGQNSD